jgi:hypothetical protein
VPVAEQGGITVAVLLENVKLEVGHSVADAVVEDVVGYPV